jgi:hypothetical protein
MMMIMMMTMMMTMTMTIMMTEEQGINEEGEIEVLGDNLP